MPIGKRTLTALMGLALCTTLAGGLLTGCDLATDQNYDQLPDSSGDDRSTSSLMAPEPPNLEAGRGGDGGS